MQYSKLELHIIQVERLISNSRKKFVVKKKKHIYENMLLLFNKIKESDYANFSPGDLAITKQILANIFYGIEFLNYNSEKEIPRRLIFCLNKLLDDWIEGGTEKYYIVVSYNNSFDVINVRAPLQAKVRMIDLQSRLLFGMEYPQPLIQISKPEFFAKDYLNSIPLYHEIGHFIESNFQIVAILAKAPWFAALNITPQHFKEFFADLFAAQYVGLSAVAPLDELDTNSYSTHPSNALRVEVVNAFINGTGSPACMTIIDVLNQITKIRTGKILQVRFEDLNDNENPFINLKPQRISNHKKIHSLFNEGWKHWLNTDSPIRKKYPKFSDCAIAINRLIQNSIRITMHKEEKSRSKRIGNCLKNVAINWGLMTD